MSREKDIGNIDQDEKSGIRRIPTFYLIQRDAFERNFKNLVEDPLFQGLFKENKNDGEGVLFEIFLDLKSLQNKYFLNSKKKQNTKKQLLEFSELFDKSMDKIVKAWPILSRLNYDWNGLCGSLFKYFSIFGMVFGFNPEIEKYMRDYFKKFELEQRARSEDIRIQQLENAEIIAKSHLSYATSIDASKKAIEEVRSKITKLESLKLGISGSPDLYDKDWRNAINFENNLSEKESNIVNSIENNTNTASPSFIVTSARKKRLRKYYQDEGLEMPEYLSETKEEKELNEQQIIIKPKDTKPVKWYQKVPLIGRLFK